MQTNKSIQISSTILLIITILGLIYALLAAIMPQFFVARAFQSYAQQSWASFSEAHAHAASYVLILKRMVGVAGFGLSLGGIFILMTAYKKGQRWAWFCMLIISLIGWSNPLFSNIATHNVPAIFVCACGLMLMVIGLLIPVKAFFSKE